jgi:protoporphyrin/coproporphyrin ferrochelatase
MYDAILLVSFGGPEQPADVIPFLERVTAGRNIPLERLAEVAEHYYHFGGKSPINDQCRMLIEALRQELDSASIKLPIYWGNRNWHPLLEDTLRQMYKEGVRRALALMTSAYSSYSGCRQYRENIVAAQQALGSEAPIVDKIRVFYNHPGFITACADRVKEAVSQLNSGDRPARLVATAHSIPSSMAETSNYERQLRETTRLVAEAANLKDWDLVYQSRSGPPSQPWLAPDILDHLRDLKARGVDDIVIAPVGFISDHMEVLYDLDTEARDLAHELGLKVVRAATVGTHPAFVLALRQLIQERLEPGAAPRLAVGAYGPNHDICPPNCCPAPVRAGRPPVLATQTSSQWS